MGQAERDTERTSVKTYIPTYQREQWERHAEQLDMSRSEFVRTMVQAGRRSFEGTIPADSIADSAVAGDPGSAESPESDSEYELDDRVLAALSNSGPLSWDELLAELTEDIEEQLEESLSRLQQNNVVQYAGRDGGYTLLEDNGD